MYKEIIAYLKLKYGKVKPQSVIGKIIAKNPELKAKIKELIPIIEQEIKEVEQMDIEQIKELAKAYEQTIEKKEKDIEIPVKDKVITRFAPNPSGLLHIGHARAIVLNHYIAKKYNGQFILRIEDTDPDVKKPMIEAYELIPKDVEWLIQEKPDKIVVQSDRLDIYYKYIEELIKQGKAYVCLCKAEEFREYRNKGLPCPHRNQSIEENLELWSKMLKGEFKKGEAVVRLKTDLTHKDPGVRDFPIARIVENPHPRIGYKPVFPLYNFAVVIDDHLLGITHVIRMKEHTNNAIKQSFIYKAFGWEEPIYLEYGALLTDMPTHKSEIRKLIEQKQIEGWDDIRLPTLIALRRRGILPEAIYEYIVKDVGLNKADIKVDWNKIYYYHKIRIDKQTPRYFMIRDPIAIVIENYDDIIDKFEIKNGIPYKKISKHPDVDLGYRELPIKEVLYIDKRDAERLKQKPLRLFELFNIKFVGEIEIEYGDEYSKTKEKAYAVRVISFDVQEAIKNKYPIVQWLPEYEETTLFELDGYKKAYVEPNIKENYVHFIREGYYKRENDKWIFSVK